MAAWTSSGAPLSERTHFRSDSPFATVASCCPSGGATSGTATACALAPRPCRRNLLREPRLALT
eukprot:4994291-Alexandrium_andersonii.AAC.1